MVVDDLHIKGVTLLPPETDSPLVIHPNTPLTFSVSVQLFKLVTWRNTQVFESLSCV